MKKISLVVLITTSIINLRAQETGIQFQKGLTWDQVLQEAKTEHKYIFVDCYASWCAPCKWMDANIYSLQEVGNAYNKDFISVRVQIDTTKDDNEDIKNWYEL